MSPPSQRERATISTPHGNFELHGFEFRSGREHAALVRGDLEGDEAPLVRVQSACLTSTAFAALLCDCAGQLQLAIQRVAEEGRGCVLYLDQEGRGHGLVEKVAHLRAINNDRDTVDAAHERGLAPDVRDYREAAAILRELIGARPIRLLTNNPSKIAGLARAGVEIQERVELETEPTEANRPYLLTKKLRMGHLLSRV